MPICHLHLCHVTQLGSPLPLFAASIPRSMVFSLVHLKANQAERHLLLRLVPRFYMGKGQEGVAMDIHGKDSRPHSFP